VDFHVEQRFAAPVEAVEAALLNPEFVGRLSDLPKIGRAELISQEEGDDGTVDQEVRYVFTGNLSAAVRAVVDPNKISWILESQFDRTAHRSSWRILPDHYGDRLSSHGETALIADGDGTRRVMDGVVKVHMALVGGRVERAIVSGLKEHAAAEAQVLEQFLTTS